MRTWQRALTFLALTGAAALGGCGGTSAPSSSSDTTASSSDTTASQDVADGGTSDSTGGNSDTASDVPKVTRNPKCGKPDDDIYGKKRPWTGFSSGGKTFTCNVCPGGIDFFQGSWRFIDFKTEDPATPLKDGYKEGLYVDGNTFRYRQAGKDEGKDVDATLEGWYFCTDPAEFNPKDGAGVVFVLDKVTPNGAFGNDTGSVFRASVKAEASDPQNPPTISLGTVFGFLEEGQQGYEHYEFLYCKAGATVNGHPCLDPFP